MARNSCDFFLKLVNILLKTALDQVVLIAGADPENSERGGRDPHPPPPRMKTSFFRTRSNKVTLTFQKILKIQEKREGCPLGPSPKSAYE